jgi:hypothetical protein
MRAVAREATRPPRRAVTPVPDWLGRSFRAASLGAVALCVLAVHVALVFAIVLGTSTTAY